MHLFTTDCPSWKRGDNKESVLKSLCTDFDHCIPQKPEGVWDICKNFPPKSSFKRHIKTTVIS